MAACKENQNIPTLNIKITTIMDTYRKMTKHSREHFNKYGRNVISVFSDFLNQILKSFNSFYGFPGIKTKSIEGERC